MRQALRHGGDRADLGEEDAEDEVGTWGLELAR